MSISGMLPSILQTFNFFVVKYITYSENSLSTRYKTIGGTLFKKKKL